LKGGHGWEKILKGKKGSSHKRKGFCWHGGQEYFDKRKKNRIHKCIQWGKKGGKQTNAYAEMI